jgi:Domain of unknown function (DUF4157)
VLAIQRAAGNQAVMRMLDARRPGHPLAGPVPAVQRSSEIEPDGDVQRAAAALHEPSDEAIRSAAADGVRTPSVPLPHLDRIQASFGRHSIAHVQAHVGPEAARASRAMNALAYASGDHVVFGSTPDLRTAAHEAAHIVQQQAGVQLSGGIGRAGDPRAPRRRRFGRGGVGTECGKTAGAVHRVDCFGRNFRVERRVP